MEAADLFSRVCQNFIEQGFVTEDKIIEIIIMSKSLEEAKTRVREEVEKNKAALEVKATSANKVFKVPWYIEAALEMLIEGALYALTATAAQVLLTIRGLLTNFLSGALTAVCVQLIESVVNGTNINIATVLGTALIAGFINMGIGGAIDNVGPLFKKLCGNFSSGIEKIVNGLGGNGTLMKSKIDILAYSIDDVIVKVKDKLGGNKTDNVIKEIYSVKDLVELFPNTASKIPDINFSSGRTIWKNLDEQIAMKAVFEDPLLGAVKIKNLGAFNDPNISFVRDGW